MKALILALLLSKQPSTANPVDCMARTMYSEAAGEPLEGIIAVGNTLHTRHKESAKSVCSLAKKGYTQKRIPKHLKTTYQILAKAILKGDIPDLVKGADSFNTGRKPVSKGRITRQINRHVFYIMSKT